MMRRFALKLVAAAGLVLTGCASAPPPAPTVAEGKDVGFNQREYVLGPSDKLRVIVFGETNLSNEFVISPAGILSMPLIGGVPADGVTVAGLEEAIAAKLRAGYLNDPRVSVEVLTYRPFYILGEVSNPGEYAYSPGLTVGRAVATARGYTYRANKSRVYIKRAGDAQEFSYPAETTVIRPGDVIRIPERLF